MIGWRRYWWSYQNRFDALTTIGAVGAVMYVVFPNGYDDYYLVKIAIMFRFCRLLRLLSGVPSFRTIFEALQAILPGGRRVLPVMFVAMLVFDVLGCDIFGGLITTDPKNASSSKLAGTAFAEGNYY